MRRKPVNPDSAQAEGVDYLLREFKALSTKSTVVADTSGTTTTVEEVTYLNDLIDVTTAGVVDGQHLVYIEAAEAFTVPVPIVTVSNTYHPSNPASALIDGNTSTKWESYHMDTGDQWCAFDFEDKVWIGQLTLYQTYSPRYAHTVTISTSPTGDNWTDIQTFSSLTASANVLTLTTPVNTQHIRITENSTVAQIWQVQEVLFHTAGDTWMPVTPGAADVSPLTTKGDVWGYDTADQRIGVGTDDHVLTADSGQTLGVKWAGPGATVTASDPTSPWEGQLVFNTTEGVLKVYVGSSWYTLSSSASTVMVSAVAATVGMPAVSAAAT